MLCRIILSSQTKTIQSLSNRKHRSWKKSTKTGQSCAESLQRMPLNPTVLEFCMIQLAQRQSIIMFQSSVGESMALPNTGTFVIAGDHNGVNKVISESSVEPIIWGSNNTAPQLTLLIPGPNTNNQSNQRKTKSISSAFHRDSNTNANTETKASNLE